MVERLVYTQEAVGSRPSPPTPIDHCHPTSPIIDVFGAEYAWSDHDNAPPKVEGCQCPSELEGLVNGISSRRQVVILLGLVGLAALVGMGSRPGAIGLGGPVLPAEPIEVLVQTGLYLGVAFDLLLMAGLVYVFWPSEPRQLRRALRLALVLMPIVLLGIVVSLFLAAPHLGPGSIGQPSGPTSAGPGALHQAHSAGITATRSTSAVLPWISLGLTAAVVLIAILAWVMSERRRRLGGQVRGLEPREAMSEAIDEGIETLLSHPDPRQAVIAAYSVMERAFARAGRARRHYETPLEFVGRILSSVPSTGADATKLAGLFELAKFSQHEIDEKMRGIAVSTLSNIRRQLQAPTEGGTR